MSTKKERTSSRKQPLVRIKSLTSYIAKRKKSWSIAAYNKKTRKRAVGDSLADVLPKVGASENADEIIVIDKQSYVSTKGDESQEL